MKSESSNNREKYQKVYRSMKRKATRMSSMMQISMYSSKKVVHPTRTRVISHLRKKRKKKKKKKKKRKTNQRMNLIRRMIKKKLPLITLLISA